MHRWYSRCCSVCTFFRCLSVWLGVQTLIKSTARCNFPASLQDSVRGAGFRAQTSIFLLLKQFSRHDVKCSVETRALSILLSTAARSFRASSGPLGQGLVWPLCVLKLFKPLHRKWFITGLYRNTEHCVPAALQHPIYITRPPKVCLVWPLELFGKPHQWHTLGIWIWMYQRKISILKNNNIYWTNIISSYFFKNGDHSTLLSMFSLLMNTSALKLYSEQR